MEGRWQVDMGACKGPGRQAGRRVGGQAGRQAGRLDVEEEQVEGQQGSTWHVSSRLKQGNAWQ